VVDDDPDRIHLAVPGATALALLPPVDFPDSQSGASEHVGEVEQGAPTARRRTRRRVTGIDGVEGIAVGESVDGDPGGVRVQFRFRRAHRDSESPFGRSVKRL
jgi:hypothetical protein